MHRIYNFSAGPCTLPLEVLEQVKSQVVEYDNTGMSLVEMSHRSKPVEAVRDEAAGLVKELLDVPEGYHVMFLGGGATFQFGMLAMNFLADDTSGSPKTADYTHSGAWAKKAIADAKKVGSVNLVFDGTDQNYMTLPDPASVKISDDAAYLHLTSNETIGGVQWKDFPVINKPIIADMSSDILSRPLPIDRFGMIYAGAQKNIGPAGVALVVISDDMLDQCPGNLPGYLNYQGHVDNNSMLNTPPVFQIWMIQLVLQWLKEKGGVAWAQAQAAERSGLIYNTISEASDFYSCPVDANFRSPMNVVFRLPSEELEKQFVEEAEQDGLSGLKGHRSVGGCRASLYNAMPIEGAQALASFMADFAQRNG